MNALYDLSEIVDTDNPEVLEDLRIAKEEIARAQEIIKNLLEFSRESGTEMEEININDLLRKTLQRDVDKRVLIEFSDTGMGIPEDHLHRIFDPFFTTKEPGQGTGLGLSVVHSIIKRYQGNISVHSKVGEGTSFLIELPCPCAAEKRRKEKQPAAARV
jgi:signal transduction histidine kinase